MFTLWDENWLWVENLFLILLKEGDRGSPAPPLMPQESETERNGFIITSYFVDLKTMKSYYLLAMYSHFSPPHFQNYNRQNPKVLNPLSKVSIWGPRGEISACRERRRRRRGSRRLLIRCCSRPPSDGAGNSHPGKPQNCPFLGLSNLLRDKIHFTPRHFQNYKRQESWFKNPLPKVSIWGPRGEVAACRRRMALVTVTRASLKIVHFLAPANPQGQNIFGYWVIGGQKCCCFNFGFW